MTDATQSSPTPIINGTNVFFGPVQREMVPLFQLWMNDFPVQARIGTPLPRPITLEDEEQWYASINDTTSRVTFAVHETTTGELIGTADLHNINLREGTAEYGVLIGRAAARGRGLGTEITQLTIDYGFTILGLHAIHLSVAEFNIAGRRAYEKAGFRECGRLREQRWYRGRRWDTVLMDCLASEFISPVLDHYLEIHG